MGTKLVIVESPGKTKTIQKYLGEGWIVKASVGHIRDLPDSGLGVEPPYFKPHYVISPDKKKVVSDLKAAAAKASDIYLATDEDREGEAIAFHLKEVLGLKNPKRVTFNEITPNSIKKAFSNPGTIDQDKVFAQEARRVIDRVVAYPVMDKLYELAKTRLSAGRVQSVAVKLIYLREKERTDFRTRKYYEVYADVGAGVLAQLDTSGISEDGKHLFDFTLAEAIQKIKTLKVVSVEAEPKATNPRPPLTTSTLQQVASSLYGFSVEKTMELAQSLYEKGIITYHRTDNPNLSDEAFQAATEFLASENIPHQDKKIKFKAKDGAQEAHEAIRPSNWSLAEAGENDKERQLYALIRERALCCAMIPAVDDTQTIILQSDDQFNHAGTFSHAKFILTGRVERTKGWREYVALEPSTTKFAEIKKEFSVGQSINSACKIENKNTEAPPRYTEASLVKALEKLGIGRPSTYASILKNIKTRSYIQFTKKAKGKGEGKTEKTLEVTELGKTLVESINELTFMNLDFTRIVEDQLDKIAQGKAGYQGLVTNMFNMIEREVNSIKIPVLATLGTCPACDGEVKRMESTKKGMKGSFFWVHCDAEHGCHDFLGDQDGSPIVKEKVERPTASCPGCGNEVQRHEKGESAFWTHTDDKHVKKCVKFLQDQEGKPFIKQEEKEVCQKCKAHIVRKFSQAKNFHFWVHEDKAKGDACIKFISDREGKPVFETSEE